MKLPTAAIEVAAFEAVEFQKHRHKELCIKQLLGRKKSGDLNRVTRKIKRYQLLEDLTAFF